MIDALTRQHEEQMDEQTRQYAKQMAVLTEQIKTKEDEMKNLIEAAHDGARGSSTPMASFQPFGSSSELWLDYLERFRTFLTANSIPKEKEAQVFLTNQSTVIYKLLSNLAALVELRMDDIQKFMGEQFDPELFVIKER